MDEFLVHFCCRHPRGWCGLKYLPWTIHPPHPTSPPARVVWIEMFEIAGSSAIFYDVATREGGVD